MKKIFQIIWIGNSPLSGKEVRWHNEPISQHFSKKTAQKAIKKLLREYKDERSDFAVMIREVWKR